ncbi:DUF3139 domain-containing protein [Paenibacillus kandeliae]|uniref:DUF3139 domain-containing protein n=1 Tax=Paenibacillus kandeliae TaxID=3231269 RepID=UPI003459363C
MKKRWWTLLLLTGIATLIVISITIKIKHLKQDLMNYLIHDQHYTAADIYSIDTKISKLPTFPMYVVFRDEPNRIYTYTDRGVGQWTQLFPNEDVIHRGGQFKHWEHSDDQSD